MMNSYQSIESRNAYSAGIFISMCQCIGARWFLHWMFYSGLSTLRYRNWYANKSNSFCISCIVNNASENEIIHYLLRYPQACIFADFQNLATACDLLHTYVHAHTYMHAQAHINLIINTADKTPKDFRH